MSDKPDIADQLQELQHSLDLLVRLKLADVRANKTQKEIVLFLGELGCNASQIAKILDLPRTSVAPILSRAKGKKNGG